MKATVGVAVWLLSLPWSATCSRSASASAPGLGLDAGVGRHQQPGLDHRDRSIITLIGRIGISLGILIGVVLLIDILLLLRKLNLDVLDPGVDLGVLPSMLGEPAAIATVLNVGDALKVRFVVASWLFCIVLNRHLLKLGIGIGHGRGVNAVAARVDG